MLIPFLWCSNQLNISKVSNQSNLSKVSNQFKVSNRSNLSNLSKVSNQSKISNQLNQLSQWLKQWSNQLNQWLNQLNQLKSNASNQCTFCQYGLAVALIPNCRVTEAPELRGLNPNLCNPERESR